MNLCKCHHVPPKGVFIKQNTYYWEYVIDGVAVIDENDNKLIFDDITFLWYFTKLINELK